LNVFQFVGHLHGQEGRRTRQAFLGDERRKFRL
jgi:hypothetical protein